MSALNNEEKSKRAINVLIPDKHPQQDLFVCDVADAVLKDISAQMEHPFYSLSKKPETNIREYRHKDNWIRIIPSAKGLATIYDKDILIYCISQIMAAINRGEKVSKKVRLSSREFLIFANRGTGGRDYKALIDSLERLAGTRISTNINIEAGDEQEFRNFGLINEASVRRKFGLDGRILWVELELSSWVFKAIEDKNVLTLHPDYFRLRKPLERRVYEIVRKHCGTQRKWKCSIDVLYVKTGSKSPKKQFKYLLNGISETDHIPDYSLNIDGDFVIFKNKGTMLPEEKPAFSGALPLAAYEAGRSAAPGWDIYQLEQEWRNWIADGKMSVKNPARHFEKFCVSWFKKRGKP